MTPPLRFALLGDPVAHSKSPVMHAAAYRALHLPHTYEAIRATAEDLPGLVQELRSGAFDGFNVTVPHKRRILDLVDVLDPSAASVGAANTLVRKDGRVLAHNTDVPALAREILRLAPERGGSSGDEEDEDTAGAWKDARAIVLGTGGAARSAIFALASYVGVGEIIVRARRGEGFASEIAPALARIAPHVRLIVEPWRASPEIERTVSVIVQATSAGMDGAEPGEAAVQTIAWTDLPPSAVAYDVVYAPPETPFLRAAAHHGVRAANGLGMLAWQGALAFELWLGVPAPKNAMLAALL